MYPTIKTAALLLCCYAFWLPTHAQTPFNKSVGGLEHARGRHIYDLNGLRYGGNSNLGPQEFKRVRYYEVPNPESPGNISGVIIDELLDSLGTVLACSAYVSYYPDPINTFYFGQLPCSTALSYVAGTDPSDIDTIYDAVIRDYDLTSYRADLDLNINTPRLYGTSAPEYYPFGPTSMQNTFAGWENSYYLGGTREPVATGPKNLTLTKLREDQTLQWMYDYDFAGGDNLLVVKPITEASIMLAARNGNSFGFMVRINPNGAVQNSVEIFFEESSTEYQAIPVDIIPSTNSSANFITIGTCIMSGSMRKTYMADFVLSGLTVNASYTYEHNGMSLDPFQIIPSGDDYVIVGMATEVLDPSEGWGFVLKVEADGTVLWAKRVELGTNDVLRSIVERNDGTFWVTGDTDFDALNPGDRNYTLTHLEADGDFIESYYYRHEEGKSAAYLLAPPTGEMLIDGFYDTNLLIRNVVKTDMHGMSLLCNTVPSTPTVANASITLDGGEIKRGNISVTATPLTPAINIPVYTVNAAG